MRTKLPTATDYAVARFVVRNLHCMASDIDVIRAVCRKLDRAYRPRAKRRDAKRRQRHTLYRAALTEHHKNRDLYLRVVRGAI